MEYLRPIHWHALKSDIVLIGDVLTKTHYAFVLEMWLYSTGVIQLVFLLQTSVVDGSILHVNRYFLLFNVD